MPHALIRALFVDGFRQFSPTSQLPTLTAHLRILTSGRGRRALTLCLIMLLPACQRSSLQPAATAPTTFNNPLNPVDGADPWLQYYEGNYYLTSTQWGSLRMWKSPTLAGLKMVKPVTIWAASDRSHCCNVWAPEFHLLDGPDGKHWYLYYSAGTADTLDNQRSYVLESSGTDPLGPYTLKRRLMFLGADTWAIDGSVLHMPDRRLYFLFSAFEGPTQNIYIAPMSNPWTISGPRVQLSMPTEEWEQKGNPVNEAPVALHHDGKIFMVYSASACSTPDYKLGLLELVGDDPLKPGAWRKHPQPMFQRSDENKVFGPGHNGFFTSPDGKENWLVYHANADVRDGCSATRTTRVQKFTWNADGTPNFGTPLPVEAPITPPSGESSQAPEPDGVVWYAIVNHTSNTCLETGASGAGKTAAQQSTCDQPGQQWALDFLENGYYRIVNRESGQVLEVAGGPDTAADGAAIQHGDWTYGANQQWQLKAGRDGWLRIVARHSEKVVSVGDCGTGGDTGIRQLSQADADCQQFRLQPVEPVTIINPNSGRVVAVKQAGKADGDDVVLWTITGTPEQQWRFEHTDKGYMHIMAGHSKLCLAVAGANLRIDGANVVQRTCADDPSQQWSFEPLSDGMVRVIGFEGRKVLDVGLCQIGDGANIQQWAWLNNTCQRFRFAVP